MLEEFITIEYFGESSLYEVDKKLSKLNGKKIMKQRFARVFQVKGKPYQLTIGKHSINKIDVDNFLSTPVGKVLLENKSIKILSDSDKKEDELKTKKPLFTKKKKKKKASK